MEGTKIEDKDLYRAALDTRNFEISLFWQRCNYFLVLNSALALGFFNVKNPLFALLLAGIGLISSMLWFTVSLGSKFWQSRWEYRLSHFERQVAPELKFFAADRSTVQDDVSKSLTFNEHSLFQKGLDWLVLKKPSVSYSMMLLALIFVLAWGISIVLFLFFPRLVA